MKPYLELPHLLSLTWLAYPIISLLFVAFRLQLSFESSQNAVASAKSDLLAACTAAEKAATSAASLPRYLAIATNIQVADAVNGTIKGARELLTLALTGMEAVINFIVDIYRSTFLCLLELVIRSGLQVLILALQELNTLVNNTASSLRTSIQNDITNANNIIQNAVNTINKANPFSKISAPQITVPSLDGLQNLTLPSTLQDALVQLNNTIPSIDDLKQKVTNLLDTPFELVKADINDTFTNLPVFDAALLPVPSQNTVTFCDQLDVSVIDELSKELVKMVKIGFAILVATALLLIGFNCLLTCYKWWALKRHLRFTRQAWMSDPTLDHSNSTSDIPEFALTDHNLLMLQANMHHPFITRLLHKLAVRLRLTPAQHCNIRWFFHYIFHPPALACFLIGLLGLLSVEVQLLALRPLEAQFSKLVVAATADFSHTIATTVNTTMYNQSATYANDINSRVDVIQSTIDDKMLGWVNDTTTTLNTTINAFYADVQNAVSTLFNGSILEAPAQEFVKCFLGSKVDAIEKTLTFLHDNLHVNVPRVNDSILVLSPKSIDEVTQPIARAAVGSGNTDDTGVVGKIIRTYEASLQKERFVFSIFMYLWAIVVLMGIIILLWSTYGRQWLENRGRRKWQKEQKAGQLQIRSPYRRYVRVRSSLLRHSTITHHSKIFLQHILGSNLMTRS
ncbi:hypothetical protein M378DRAFT_755866 [Amanita muscaria Koide BX008]|uniref:Plasma membrane fusion protein PRM1 n=1 Tax=Amanita muscaria (strain Koide BX008) TaxID=946122 RepID=A0A0C2T7J8_AMAMK|nr:hypothetical protein M378DRAFT_755866 [Amanita muscaria Koide BX008]